MKRADRIISLAIITVLVVASVIAQNKAKPGAAVAVPRRKNSQSSGVAAGLASVKGSGTAGQLAKWSGDGTNLDNSIITETKSGNIGIGTATPASKLSVDGVIETTSGFKFPDGTLQTTVGLANVFRDTTLKGNGTEVSPLGLAVPLKLSGGELFGSVLEVSAINANSVGITIHGGGNGTAVQALAGNGGDGVVAVGGFSGTVLGGGGVTGLGGKSDIGFGGAGVTGVGGDSNSGRPGAGLEADGGNGTSSDGGRGVRASGGTGSGSGKSGGIGIEAFGGLGMDGATVGLAGKFNGDVQVTGSISKAGGSFKIDHPLDPENKYLSHSFVESPDMKNIYDGVASLDSNGEAVVEMPEWFSALNRDFRYLLTALGAPMPGLYVSQEIANNRFKISGGLAGMRVSWQVTGIRQDAWANQHRIPVEETKSEKERGRFLHPAAFGQPQDRGITRAEERELRGQIKKRHDSAEQAIGEPK